METFKDILEILISWPTAVIISVLVLRVPIKMLIERLINSEAGEAKLGPVEIKLGKLAERGRDAVESLGRINVVMAESRLLELEITQSMFGNILSEEQAIRMRQQIKELGDLTDAAAKETLNNSHFLR